MGRHLFQELIFDFPTDSVEFSHDQEGGLLAVGMYQLENPQTENRIGTVAFLRMNDQDECFYEFSRVALSGGLLDMKWVAGSPTLITATSQDVAIITYDKIIKSLTSNNALHLSLDLLNDKCLSTGSNGNCSLFNLTTGENTITWNAHSLETWCGAFQEEYIVFTGADDSLLKAWDLRASTLNPFSVNRSHKAGVCSIVPLQHRNLLVTGSYDANLRIFDFRNLSLPINTVKFDSGVWRIKHHSNKLLLACMSGGFRILDISTDNITCEFHAPSESLAYGCSWGGDRFIAGASFYDCKVKIWEKSE